MRDAHDPEVISYLQQENAFAEESMADVAALRNDVFDEIKSRIKQNDRSAPYKYGDYMYYHRFEKDKEYPIYARHPVGDEASEQVLLNANELAEGASYFSIGSVEVSPSHQIIAYTVDTIGRRIFTLKFVDLASGRHLPDVVKDVTSNIEWGQDDRTIFYTRQDPVTLRWSAVCQHELGSPQAADSVVYEEPDTTFGVHVYRSKSRRYMFIESRQTISSEVRYLDLTQPMQGLKIFNPRRSHHEYTVDHVNDTFFVLTNRHAENFEIATTIESETNEKAWSDFLPPRADTLVESFELFSNFAAVSERSNGLTRIHIIPFDQSDPHFLHFDEPAFLAYTSINMEADTDRLRYGYTSLTTPTSIFEYDMRSRQQQLIKEDEVVGDFDRSRYRSVRMFAKANDGTKIPMSVVYRADINLDGTAPALLYGYGSYGYSIEPTFNSARLSLLDRGFVFAIAHVRGGEEMGREWYNEGKLMNKKNTFTDFIACGEKLLASGLAHPRKLFAQGGSAGGLLVAAVINMRPDLFAGVIAGVPFVDVVTTMLDESIPLTTGEYDEWGNPNEEKAFRYMLSYSPYDNVRETDYPSLLVTSGLHDSQVQFWEPTKWVAKLRARKTDDNILLLKTNMDAGHSGASGRFRRQEEIAFEYTFLLKLADINRSANTRQA